MMDKVHKHNLFNTNTPLSESYKNYPFSWLEKPRNCMGWDL